MARPDAPRETSRAAEARGLQTRDSAMREMILREERGMLWWDDSKRPHNMQYGWIRRAVGNEQDQFNVTSRQQSGWMPVPPDRHPELTGSGWGLTSDKAKPYIERAGLVLCEIPMVVFEAHQALQKKKRFEALKMPHIEQMTHPDAEKALPMWDMSRTGFEKVESFEQMASEDEVSGLVKEQPELQD